ncbi:GlxA family transcriptional regulator [Gluconacetobacter azotocaptans]|uniref:GlxA family transcriptional regulator n=1 Tax=Gluconacetobacter azotocaptans TaxID=142834 RepID=UPI0022321D8D|nr:GlxA family transcriptional regulator [Gluconacetobacter azotocaptans]
MTVRIGFLLIPRFSALGFLCAAEPLRVANRLAEERLFEWTVFSEDGRPVAASNGMQIAADAPLGPDAALDSLVVVAGFEPLKQISPRLPRLLRRLAARRGEIGALDTGAFVLAQARLVDQVPVTMHWEVCAAFAEAFPDLMPSSELFEDHGRIFTSAGGTASIDLMLHRIARLHGPRLARRVAEQFIHSAIRLPGEPQRRRALRDAPAGGRILARLTAWMESVADRRVAPGELSDLAGRSPRHIERLFRRQYGWGPAAHHRKLRLARARTLLRETALSIVDIADACGFESRSNFSRAYRSEFGIAPARDRVEP